MAPSSSSTKKAAKLAKSGQGKKVRFQGGTLFPMVLAIVVVLGLSLVVYARQSRPAADASAPQITDHWHHAYGFYLCDSWFQLSGDVEDRDDAGFLNTDFARTGVHSHSDGLIHWHPFSAAAVGSRAKLGVFLDVYGVELTNDKLQFPESQRPGLPHEQETGLFEEGETTCTIDGDEQDAELKVVVWENFTDTDNGTTFIADFNNIRLDRDQMVVAIAFVPDDTDVSMPPWAPELPSLGALDEAQLTPDDLLTGTVPGGMTDEPSSTEPGAPATTEG
ncbi:MAG TPA: hypothetical protein VK853_11835 [Ilumatobacteraceae bacterium]|nr:hypothetical protein [Ilumatobacteraceae bacterium]